MAKLLKLRRGTTTQHGSFTGAEGEVTIDTTKDTAVVHDGSQAGGRPLLREDMSNLPAGTIDNADINASAAIAGTKISPNFGSQDIETTGKLLIDDNIDMPDNAKVIIGTGDDLQLFHNGNHSIIAEVGTGNLQIRAADFRVTNADNTETMIVADTNGAVELYHNNSKKCETFGNGIIVYGPEAGGGLINLYADEGDDNADKWRIHANPNGSFYLQNYTSGSWENNLAATGNGATFLNYDNAVKFETTSSGADVTGRLTTDGVHVGDGGNNDISVSIGASNDLRLYHDGSNSYITERGTGDLFIRNGNDDAIRCRTDDAVELYHNNSKKLETSTSGVTVTGSLSTTGNVTPTGYIKLTDSQPLYVGTGNDLEIYHGSGYNIINTATAANLDIKNGSEYVARFAPNGNNELFYDNSKKFETYANGFKFHGHQIGQTAGQYIQWQGANSNAFAVGMTSGTDSPTGSDEHLQFHHWNNSAWEKTFYVQRHSITVPDSNKVQLGDSGDLQIYHDGSNSYVYQDGTGELRVNATTYRIQNRNGNETQFYATENGKVILYYDNSNKLETTSQGIKITATNDIRMHGGTWTGEFNGGIKLQPDASSSYFQYQGTTYFRNSSGSNRLSLDSSGNLAVDGNVTAYSDARLKTDIHTINDALGICGKLRGVSYKWLENGKASIGVIAQEVEEVIPEVVLTNVNTDPVTGIEKEVKSVDYGKIVGVLINAINELKAEIDELKGGK